MNMSEFRKNALHNGWKLGENDCLYPEDIDKIAEVYYGLEIERYKTGNIRYAALHGEKISNGKANTLLNKLRYAFITNGGLINCSINEYLKPEFSAQAYSEEKQRELDMADWFEFEEPKDVIKTSEKAVLLRTKIGDMWLPKSLVLVKDGKAVKAEKKYLRRAMQKLKNAQQDRQTLAEILGVDLGAEDFWNAKFYSYQNGERAVFVGEKKIVLTDEQVEQIKAKIPQCQILSIVLHIRDADSWNKKVYSYKDGTYAVFVNNEKIMITKEQADEIEQLLM